MTVTTLVALLPVCSPPVIVVDCRCTGVGGNGYIFTDFYPTIELGTMKVLKIGQQSKFFFTASKGPYVKFKYYSYATYLVLFFFMGALLTRNLATVQSPEILNS
jgi:hypothetical protein